MRACLSQLDNSQGLMYNKAVMKLTAQVKLKPTHGQKEALLNTLTRVNEACNYISARAWETKTFRQYDLHKLVYYDTRERFGLRAQMTVRAIAKVADAYKAHKRCKRVFKPLGSIAFDARNLSWRTHTNTPTVSISTMEGRQRIPFSAGERQRELLERRQGEADLLYRNNEFYLYQCCDIGEPDSFVPDGWLGIDVGIVNIAVTSDGQIFSGDRIGAKRRHYEWRRASLQSVGTKSAKRRLRQLSGRQHRFQTDTNHCVSKTVVAAAKCTHRGIALEDLKGIRGRTKVRRGQRSRHSNWAFYQLRAFVQYKGLLAGVPVVLVDPRDTSKTCSKCGHCSKSNRPTRDKFCCTFCGHVAPADVNAAVNIAAKATVNLPMVSTEVTKTDILVSNCATARG